MVGVISLIVGYALMHGVQRMHVRLPENDELKVCLWNLEHTDDGMSPELREYLKGRMYAQPTEVLLAAGTVDRIDHGRLDRKLLKGLYVVKGPDSDDDLYEYTMKAFGCTPQPRLPEEGRGTK
jgi:hypothetical protein